MQNTTADQKKNIVDSAKRTIEDYSTGALEGNMGYRFQTRAVMEVIYLYKHGVDVRNPDLLGRNNKNTFIYEAQGEIEKIKEQVRLDIVDMGFQVPGASTLGRFIPKAANRKMLEENDFAETLDQVPDDAIDYGSGFLKVWRDEKKMKIRSIDPFDIYFNQYNFKGGLKIEKLKKKVSWIIENEKYDADERLLLAGEYPEGDRSKEITLFQVVEDLKDGKQRVSVVDIEREKCFYSYVSDEKLVWYYKFDCEKRRGFADALGIGKNERIFNRLVQGKVNRERMDRVLEIASILAFQKQMDNERDNYVGKEVSKLKPSAILGHKGNPISLLDTGGVKQASMITAQLGEIVNSIGADLNVGDALQGETLPSGTSGALGNLLAENQSSVHKEIQKKYGNFLGIVYKECLTPYILEIFDATDNLKNYLDPNDIKLVEKNVINYMVGLKQVDAAILDKPFDLALATEEVKREIKDKPLISGELLDQLRTEAQAIQTYITGEKVSKAKSVAFIRELRAAYVANPALFKDPFYVSMIKKEAEFEAGLEPIEIDNLLSELV
jgi:hypothetical protein